MILGDFTKFDLPDSPGVYFFLRQAQDKSKKKEILYVGKATSLRSRVRSYFAPDLITSRGPLLVKMLEEADIIEWKETPSVLEALVLEAYEIKTHQPIYNSKEKDDKSYNYVVITDEEFPRVLVERGKSLLYDQRLQAKSYKLRASFGPFPHGGQLREALRIVRKIFPYRDKCIPFDPKLTANSYKLQASPRPCFNHQLGLCPGVCIGTLTSKEYERTIKNIELFFSGRTDKVRKNLEREMKSYAKAKEFEKAEKTKHSLFALDHIRDVGLIKEDRIKDSLFPSPTAYRIEAYDIAHISGAATVGVMVVLEDGELVKDEYRKFKIRGDGQVKINDTRNLEEILVRRLGHAEWPLPNLIVLDGGTAQLSLARKVLKERGFDIDTVSVVKDERHKPKDIIGEKKILNKHSSDVLRINNEAHRFAVAYHSNLRGRQFRGR